MGWQEAKKRYEDGETLTPQAVEDLVARRVLRGLSIKDDEVYRAERKIYGDADPDLAMWPRAHKLLRGVTAQKDYNYQKLFNTSGVSFTTNPEFVIEVIPAYADHREIKERFDHFFGDTDSNGAPKGSWPLIMTRTRGSTTSLTFIPVNENDPNGAVPWYMKPPFTALTRRGWLWTIMQETEWFVAQLDLQDTVRELLSD